MMKPSLLQRNGGICIRAAGCHSQPQDPRRSRAQRCMTGGSRRFSDNRRSSEAGGVVTHEHELQSRGAQLRGDSRTRIAVFVPQEVQARIWSPGASHTVREAQLAIHIGVDAWGTWPITGRGFPVAAVVVQRNVNRSAAREPDSQQYAPVSLISRSSLSAL